MKIKTLIKELQQCVNPDADVHIVCGGESDLFDATKFYVSSDHSDDGYQDIFISATSFVKIPRMCCY